MSTAADGGPAPDPRIRLADALREMIDLNVAAVLDDPDVVEAAAAVANRPAAAEKRAKH